jgi:hypothetical protein
MAIRFVGKEANGTPNEYFTYFSVFLLISFVMLTTALFTPY